MVHKVVVEGRSRLVCCDCGFDLGNAKPAQRKPTSSRSQWITAGLIALFGLTAAGLMTLKDQLSPSLMEDQPLNLNERRQEGQETHRWRTVLPRPSSPRD